MMTPLTIQQITELWEAPRAAAEPVSYAMKRDLKAPMLWQILERDHSVEEVRSVVHAWLREAGEIMWQDRVLDRWQIFATQCCLTLMNEVELLAPGAELTKQLVRKYESLLSYLHLGRWVAEYLDAAELLDTLAEGLRSAPTDWVCSSCLAGLRLYYPSVKRRASLEEFEASLGRFDGELRKLQASGREGVRESLGGAREAVWTIRRKNTRLSKPAQAEYKAYRIGSDAEARYAVERLNGDIAINIPSFEVRNGEARIAFECLDPALLPEDAPSVLEASVLREYALNDETRAIASAQFTDLTHKKTIPLALRLP